MADNIRYIHPSEQVQLTADFQLLLPSNDSAVNTLANGSAITATKLNGSDAEANLFTKTQSGKTLSVILKNLVDGEEYTVTFLGQGATSTQRFTRVVLVLCRKHLTGEF